MLVLPSLHPRFRMARDRIPGNEELHPITPRELRKGV